MIDDTLSQKIIQAKIAVMRQQKYFHLKIRARPRTPVPEGMGCSVM